MSSTKVRGFSRRTGGRGKVGSESIVSKLIRRETFGGRSRRGVSRLFTRIPGRLAFCLKDVIPESALVSGHIFLGFSKCGQFLMSYTQTAVDMQIEVLGDSMEPNYHYRLHWWSFLPYKRAKKVAEVLLFSNEGAPGNLHLSFCQWPNEVNRALIYGMLSYREEGEAFVNCYMTVTAAPSLRGCKECVKVASSYEEDDVAEAWNSCIRLSCLEHGMTIHTSFDILSPHPKFEPKISMKRDGYVIINTGNILHSLSVEIEPLGPKKDSDESHSTPPSTTQSLLSPKATMTTAKNSLLSVCSRRAEVDVGMSEFTFAYSEPRESSPSPRRPFLSHHLTSDSDCEDPPLPSPPKSRRRNERLERAVEFVNQLPHAAHLASTSSNASTLRRSTSGRSGSSQRMGSWFSESSNLDEDVPCSSSSLPHVGGVGSGGSIIQSVVTRLEPTSVSITPGSSGINSNGTSGGSSLKKRFSAAAEKAYEINEHDFESEGIQENLSTFRRKRLADKKYELTDDDFNGSFIQEKLSTFRKKRKNAENLSPPSPPEAVPPPQQHIRSPRSNGQDSVLRPLTSNQQQQTDEEVLCLSEVELSSMPELLSPGGMVNKKDQSCFSPRESITSSPPPPPRMHFKYTRRYIEADDEMTSVITDIEGDDDDGGSISAATAGRSAASRSAEGCYHHALPVEAHGSGYQFMPMISNHKAEKLSGNCVKVQQKSLDLECFCLDMAQKLCKAADKNYWFCNDYDVEIIDVNPESGDVICVAVVLVQATVVTKKVSPMQKYSISSLHRRQYQGGFKFCWNIDEATCVLVDSDPLKEINAFKREPQGSIWHPATSISLSLQRQLGLQENGVKSITNEAVIGGTSLKTIVDTEHVVAIVLDNLD